MFRFSLVYSSCVGDLVDSSINDGSDPTVVVDGGVSRSDVEDVDMPFEVLFSVKKSDKPDALLVNRKETVYIKSSDWEARTDVVRATNSKGESGIIPSTHVKASRKSTLKGGKGAKKK